MHHLAKFRLARKLFQAAPELRRVLFLNLGAELDELVFFPGTNVYLVRLAVLLFFYFTTFAPLPFKALNRQVRQGSAKLAKPTTNSQYQQPLYLWHVEQLVMS